MATMLITMISEIWADVQAARQLPFINGALSSVRNFLICKQDTGFSRIFGSLFSYNSF
jgi:hypothetical protein